ncbi:MAG TPA: TetR family transcriptional regulator [Pseudonocardiaceae bacterium]|jgi:AcrR family transcriptional regulator|nr:TetR family transcriptional regulator [Pseudonocardiaceae bacterium]
MSEPHRRRDAARNRTALLRAGAELLSECGPGFSLEAVAARANVSTSTAYRNFTDGQAVVQAYLDQLGTDLLSAFDVLLADEADPLGRVRGLCRVWVTEAAGWGRSVAPLRSAQGFLARRAAGDAFVTGLYQRLADVLGAAMRAGQLPRAEVRYAVLVWITLFDERLVVDLVTTEGWSVERVARRLTSTLIRSLGGG